MNTVDLLDRIKKRHRLQTDGQLARHMQVRESHVSLWRTGRRRMGEEMAIEAASYADLPPEYVLAELKAERAKHPALKKVWKKAAKQLRQAAAYPAVVLALISSDETTAALLHHVEQCILCKVGRIFQNRDLRRAYQM